jgi:hypothetical protein
MGSRSNFRTFYAGNDRRGLAAPSVCVPGFSEASSFPGAGSHGVASTVADRVMDADDESFMKTSKDAQARSGTMLLT